MKKRFLATIPIVLIMLVATGYAFDSTNSPKPTSQPEAVQATCSTPLGITLTTFQAVCGVAFVPRITGRAHITIIVSGGSTSSTNGSATVAIIKSTSGIPSPGSAIPVGDTVVGPVPSASVLASSTGYVVTIPDEALDTSLTVGTTVFFYIAVRQSGGISLILGLPSFFGCINCNTEIIVIEP